MNHEQLRVTKHVMARCQQRGISRDAVDVLLKYGKRRYSRDGISIYMDKRSRWRAKMDMGESTYGRLEDQLDFYVVVSLDGTRLITAAHRLRRRRG